GGRLSARARGAAPPSARRRPRRRHRPLLRARHLGNGRVAGAVSPFRRTGGVGESRGDTVNRVLDATVAGLGLAFASPALAVAALAIKLDDSGPVFYRQRRVGLNGEPFELLKLRTMKVGSEHKGAGY